MKVCVGPGFFTDRASSCEFKDSRTSNITMRGKAAHSRGNRGATVGLLKLPPCQARYIHAVFIKGTERNTGKEY